MSWWKRRPPVHVVRWAWKCSVDGCDFAEDQPEAQPAIAEQLLRCVAHEDGHPGHRAVNYRVVNVSA